MRGLGRIQSVCGPLGDPGGDEGDGYRVDPAAGEGKVPWRYAADYLGQRTAVHRSGFQRVHQGQRHDACANEPVLPAVEREAGAVERDREARVHPSQDADEPGRGAACRRRICDALLRTTSAQCHRLRDAEGQAGGPRRVDSGRAGPEAGSGSRSASSAAPGRTGGLTAREDGIQCGVSGETEAGSAGKQPAEG